MKALSSPSPQRTRWSSKAFFALAQKKRVSSSLEKEDALAAAAQQKKEGRLLPPCKSFGL